MSPRLVRPGSCRCRSRTRQTLRFRLTGMIQCLGTLAMTLLSWVLAVGELFMALLPMALFCMTQLIDQRRFNCLPPEFVASRVLIDALVPGSLVQPVLTTRGRIHDVVDYGTDDKLLTMLQAFASGYSPGHEPKTNLNTSFLKRVGIRSILERAFREAAEEVFEYGMESRLSRTLGFLVQRYSNDAVAELDRALLQEDAVLEVREEALLQLGSIEHKPTQRSRLYLLIKHLKSNLVSVRDSAALGIAAMDDPLAIPPLRHAVQVEPSGRLRKDLQLVLDQLMATKGCQIT